MNLPSITIDSVFLFTAWGALSSLLASYVPGFNEWFAGLSETKKRLIMLAGIFLIAGIAVLLTVLNVWVLIPMTKDGILLLVINIFLAISANQGTYKISPVARSVKTVKDHTELARLVSLSSMNVVKPK